MSSQEKVQSDVEGCSIYGVCLTFNPLFSLSVSLKQHLVHITHICYKAVNMAIFMSRISTYSIVLYLHVPAL